MYSQCTENVYKQPSKLIHTTNTWLRMMYKYNSDVTEKGLFLVFSVHYTSWDFEKEGKGCGTLWNVKKVNTV